MRISDTDGSPSDTSDALFVILPASSVDFPDLPDTYSIIARGIAFANQFEVKYSLPEYTNLRLAVYDIKGTKIKEFSEGKPAGFYSQKIDMSNNPAGVYFIKMDSTKEKFTEIRKIILIK